MSETKDMLFNAFVIVLEIIISFLMDIFIKIKLNFYFIFQMYLITFDSRLILWL